MSSILMCKERIVYNIDEDRVYNFELLPGFMQRFETSWAFKRWFALRYNSTTNSIARHIRGISFGQGKRSKINRETHAFSLSDPYWIQDSRDHLDFYQNSPYYMPFWCGSGAYHGGAIPTLYVGGYLGKEWISAKVLNKYGDNLEVEELCSRLCQVCGVLACQVKVIKNGISVLNITTPDRFLEQADQSGLIDIEEFDEGDIERLFGIDGIRMLVIDAIVGNGDRHAGNFGWMRDGNTGKYLGMAPLYDFDHALDSTSEIDMLITDALGVIRGRREYIDEAIRIATLAIQSNITVVIYSASC